MKKLISIVLLLSFVFVAIGAKKQDPNAPSKKPIPKEVLYLIVAIGEVESGNDDTKIGDNGKSIGRYQISEAAYIDSKTQEVVGGTWQDCHEKKYAALVLIRYVRWYERKALENGDLETICRFYNSGPNWRKKKHLTDGYWKKVKAEYDKVAANGGMPTH